MRFRYNEKIFAPLFAFEVEVYKARNATLLKYITEYVSHAVEFAVDGDISHFKVMIVIENELECIYEYLTFKFSKNLLRDETKTKGFREMPVNDDDIKNIQEILLRMTRLNSELPGKHDLSHLWKFICILSEERSSRHIGVDVEAPTKWAELDPSVKNQAAVKQSHVKSSDNKQKDIDHVVSDEAISILGSSPEVQSVKISNPTATDTSEISVQNAPNSRQPQTVKRFVLEPLGCAVFAIEESSATISIEVYVERE